MNKLLLPPEPVTEPNPLNSRRSFLRYTGAGVAITGLLLAGCDDDSDGTGTGTDTTLIDVGPTGPQDLGVLNYAYALEQLGAAFYAQVRTGTYYTGLATTSAEKQILDDVASHERAHVDFFRTVLGTNAIKALEPDFGAINFNDRNSVLTNARDFADLGVAAYNGSGRFIQVPVNLVLAGKIVSVEARHAGLIRDLLTYNSFVGADVVDLFTPASATSAPGDGNGTGKEKSKTPTQVLETANKFLKTGSRLSANNLK